MSRLQGPQFRPVSLEGTASDRQKLANIDVRVIGVSREKHHQYLLSDKATKGIGLYSGEECVGYAYVSTGGHIGPLAVARPDALGSAFTTALALAVEIGSSQVSAFLPGAGEAALRIAVVHGMRIAFPMLLMSTRQIGDWSGYLPRNPGFM